MDAADAARRGGPPMALRFGRTIYEGSCQKCHGPDLKGDRGPAVNDAVKRLGADAMRKIVKNGKGGMPGVSDDERRGDYGCDRVPG